MENITSTTLYWVAMFLIIEPALVKIWPRIRASFFLSFPYRESRLSRIEQYYNGLERPFGIMCPFRVKARQWMQAIGVCILILMLTNQMFNLIKL